MGPIAAKRILNRLALSSSTKETLLKSILAPEDHEIPLDYVELTQDQLIQLDEWYYSATLELSRKPGIKINPISLSQYLGISVEQARSCIKKLIALGLAKKTEVGLRKIHRRATASPKTDSSAIKKIHEGYLREAIGALNDLSKESYSISGVTFLASEEKIPEAVRRIQEFRRSLAHFLDSETDTSSLYRMNIQLFPLKRKVMRKV